MEMMPAAAAAVFNTFGISLPGLSRLRIFVVGVTGQMRRRIRIDVRIRLVSVDSGLKDQSVAAPRHEEEVRTFSRHEHGLLLLEDEVGCLVQNMYLHRGLPLDAGVCNERFELLTVDMERVGKLKLCNRELRDIDDLCDYLIMIMMVMGPGLFI